MIDVIDEEDVRLLQSQGGEDLIIVIIIIIICSIHLRNLLLMSELLLIFQFRFWYGNFWFEGLHHDVV